MKIEIILKYNKIEIPIISSYSLEIDVSDRVDYCYACKSVGPTRPNLQSSRSLVDSLRPIQTRL